jgi:hypothetical protein
MTFDLYPQDWHSGIRPVEAAPDSDRLWRDSSGLGHLADPDLHEGQPSPLFPHFLFTYAHLILLGPCSDASLCLSSQSQFPEYFEVKPKYEP